jgi:hypothetical protein
MSQALDRDSDLGKILYKLPGLNCQTGHNDLLGTCDPKHVFKHFATLIRSPVGILIHDTNIHPLDIVDNLTTMG